MNFDKAEFTSQSLDDAGGLKKEQWLGLDIFRFVELCL